jgi:hypothetical protein
MDYGLWHFRRGHESASYAVEQVSLGCPGRGAVWTVIRRLPTMRGAAADIDAAVAA